MYVPNWIKKRADITPERIAIIDNGVEYSFSKLFRDVKVMAGKLSSIGVKKDSHIALAIKNSYESVVIIHALQSIGAVMVLLNTRLTTPEIVWQIDDSDSSLFIYDNDFSDKAKHVTSLNKLRHVIAIDQLKNLPISSSNILDEFNLDDVHTIIYTSGTTGSPKGVMLSNGNHWWSAIGSALNLGLDVNDRWLACLPLFHVSGLSIIMRSVIYGISVVLHEKYDPVNVNKAIEIDNVTIVSVVSVMLQQMIDLLETDSYPENLRCVLLGGGPAPRPLLELSRAKKIPVFQTYGMTETASQIVTLAPEYMLSKLGSAGKPLYSSQLKIKTDDMKEAAANEIGEILVKGPNVTSGYYKQVKKTNQSINDGWLYTGDLGYIDNDGFLFVIDRRTDLIISGGENIYPAEIESVLTGHPAIKEAGVVGVDNEKWGQIPIAFIVLEQEQQVSDLQLYNYCKENLAGYKIPQEFYRVIHLPRNAANKLVRRKLLDLIAYEN